MFVIALGFAVRDSPPRFAFPPLLLSDGFHAFHMSLKQRHVPDSNSPCKPVTSVQGSWPDGFAATRPRKLKEMVLAYQTVCRVAVRVLALQAAWLARSTTKARKPGRWKGGELSYKRLEASRFTEHCWFVRNRDAACELSDCCELRQVWHIEVQPWSTA